MCDVYRMQRRIIIPLLAALLTGALAASPACANSAPPEAEGGEAGEAAEKIGMPALKPLPVAILKGNRVEKYIVVMLSLAPAPGSDVQEITHDLPRVNDAALREAYLFAKENAGGDDVDLEALRARLLAVINAALGEGKISGIYITDIKSF